MTNQVKKRNDEQYITLWGVRTGDKYDKSKYRWDPQLKKTVYIKQGGGTNTQNTANNQMGNSTGKPTSIDWMKEVQTMSANNRASLSENEIKEYATMYSNAMQEYQKTGKINEDLKQLTDTLKENALNGDTQAKELYNKIANSRNNGNETEQQKTSNVNKLSENDYSGISQLAMEYTNAHNGYKGMTNEQKEYYGNEFKNSFSKAIKEKSYEPIMPFVRSLTNLANDNTQYEYNNIAVTPERKKMAKQYLNTIQSMLGKGINKVNAYARRESRMD